MSQASGNNHQGIFMENGSGGFMGDLTFNGGKANATRIVCFDLTRAMQVNTECGLETNSMLSSTLICYIVVTCLSHRFTVRNVTFNNANTAIYSIWNWGWTFQGVTINNCQVGIDLMTGGLTQSTQVISFPNSSLVWR